MSETKTTLRLPDKLLLRAKHRALDEGLTLQGLVERALEAYLKTPLKRHGGER